MQHRLLLSSGVWAYDPAEFRQFLPERIVLRMEQTVPSNWRATRTSKLKPARTEDHAAGTFKSSGTAGPSKLRPTASMPYQHLIRHYCRARESNRGSASVRGPTLGSF